MDPIGTLSIKTYSVDGATKLVVAGELDLATGEQLSRALEWIEATGEELVIVDLAAVSFVDASGLRTLVTARDSARMRGATLELRNPSPALRRLMRLARVDDLIDTADLDA